MTQRTKSVTVLVGLPASGKSTARAIAAGDGPAGDSYQYSTDDEIEKYAAEVESTYSEVFTDYAKIATKIADEGLEQALNDGKNVLWDQTNMTVKKRRKILNKFPQDYVKQCVCILPPLNDEQEKELVRRLGSRAGKSIPPFVMKSMRDNFQIPTTNEGFDTVMYFDIYGKMVDRNSAADIFGNI